MILVVVESHFGNTVALGEAMAAALCADGTHAVVRLAHEAASTLPAAVDMLVVGAPTHNGALSTPATRTRAAGIGAKDSTDLQGVREWLIAVDAGHTHLVVFDTVRAGDEGSRSAADEAVDLVDVGSYASVTRGQTFGVDGVAGPLAPGELVRARRWALGGFAMHDVT